CERYHPPAAEVRRPAAAPRPGGRGGGPAGRGGPRAAGRISQDPAGGPGGDPAAGAATGTAGDAVRGRRAAGTAAGRADGGARGLLGLAAGRQQPRRLTALRRFKLSNAVSPAAGIINTGVRNVAPGR